jgi:hypothetical protein
LLLPPVDVVVATAAAEKQSAALRDAIGNLASTAGCCSPWHVFSCCSGPPAARPIQDPTPVASGQKLEKGRKGCTWL